MPRPMTGLVAVTGATGFIGQTLVTRLLERGWRVRMLARHLPSLPLAPHGAAEIVPGDLADAMALQRLTEGVDAVAHLAGLIKARKPAEFFAANRDGVEAVLRAFAARAGTGHGRRFVLLSSMAAREPGLSPYGASKRAGEEVLRQAAGDLPWAAIRAPVVYGPGDRETLRFFQLVRRGWAPVAGAGKGRLSTIHVDDLADALIALLAGDMPPPDAYEIDDGHEQGYVTADLARIAAAKFEVRARQIGIPKTLLQAVAALQQGWNGLRGRPTMVSLAKVNEIFHPDWLRHDRRLENLIGWRATMGLQTGIDRTIDWYREKLWL